MKRSLLFFVYLFILSAILPNFADVDAQLINEFSSAAGSTSDSDYPDWVEVYFEEGQDKSLYQLTDGNGNMKNLSEAVCNVNICTVDWSNRLDNEGDQIKLELISSPGVSIDQITYGGSGNVCIPGDGYSIGRVAALVEPYPPTNVWERFSTKSKGLTNNNSVLSPCPAPTSIPMAVPTNTPVPTNAPTQTPVPTSTTKPTSTPTRKPTSTPKDLTAQNQKIQEEADMAQFRFDSDEEADGQEVLGATGVSDGDGEPAGRISPFAYVLFGLGVIFIGVSAVMFVRNRKMVS